MVYFISKAHFYHDVRDNLINIFKETRIFLGRAKYHFKILNRWKDDCAIGFSVEAKNNIFNKKVEIIIKPDHGEQRVMRAVILIGNKIVQKEEDFDHPNWNEKKIFLHEIHALERDIRKALISFKQAA